MSEDFKSPVLSEEDWGGLENNALVYDKDAGGLMLKPGLTDTGTDPYISKSLDSGLPGSFWRRIVLDADIPENSTLAVSFRAVETPKAEQSWSEPVVFAGLARDAVVPQVSGRYLEMKFDFHREGEKSPVLRQVQVFPMQVDIPPMSYLRYLPAAYQEKETIGNFQERFLSIFETIMAETGEIIIDLPRYLDPETAPPEFYHWLAGWLALDLYELLGEKNRQFILRANEFYQQKGTVAGLENLVFFLTGYPCCVKEYRNNVFRSYGMEHDNEPAPATLADCREQSERPPSECPQAICTRFNRVTSKTLETTDPELLDHRGQYCDRIHYVYGKSDSSSITYANHTIGLYIFRPLGKALRFDKKELPKMINAFLPVFVEAHIFIVDGPSLEFYYLKDITDSYTDQVAALSSEQFDHVVCSCRDDVPVWQWLYSYGLGHEDDGRTYVPGDSTSWNFRTYDSYLRTWHAY